MTLLDNPHAPASTCSCAARHSIRAGCGGRVCTGVRGPGQAQRRRHRDRDRGVTMVEFALLAPLFFLMVMGLIVSGIVVTNQVQLNNVVRDAARVAGACGS